MASGNRPVADARLNVRIPLVLKLLLEGMAVRDGVTLSYIVTQLLETHPEVVKAAGMLYHDPIVALAREAGE